MLAFSLLKCCCGGRMQAQQHLSLGHIQELIQNKKYRKALGQLSKLSIQFSQNKDFLLCLAEVQGGLGDYNALLKTYQVLAFVDLDNSSFYRFHIIHALYKLNRKNEALDVIYEFLNQVSERSTKIKVLLILAKIYIEENDFEGVEEALDELSLLKCENEFTCWAAGVIELHRKNFDLALTYFRKSIIENSNQDYAWVSLSMLHYEMGDRLLALANLEKAIDLNPLNPIALKLYAMWNTKNADKQEKALNRVRFYLSQHSFDEDMGLCFVKMLCQSKQWVEAEFELDKMILNNPHNENFNRLKNSLLHLKHSC